MAKVLIVNSSYRKNSNSNLISEQIAKGAQEAGHSVTTLDISRLEIKPCHACYACLSDKAIGCVQKDGMTNAYPMVREADVIIYAAPIYWFNLGGQIKQFIDRCFAIASKRDADGKSPFAKKGLGAALAFEGDDPFDSGCINALRSLQDICSYTGAKWLGAAYGSANDQGEMQQNAKALQKAYELGKRL